MRRELIYFSLAVVGIATSILLLLQLITYMVIADDLAKEVIRQQYYIKELEWENQQTEMICSNIEVE